MTIQRPSKEKLERLYWKDNLSTPKIAKLFDVPCSTVWRWMVTLRIKRRTRKEAAAILYPTPPKEELERLYWKKKLSIAKIAKLYGVKSTNRVENWMKRLEIKRRTRKEAALLIPRARKNKRIKGYIKVHAPDHTRADAKGYVLEHILNWEKAHGKSVPKGHLIHHLNGIRKDNRPENLVAVPVPQHERNTLLKIAQKRIRELEAELQNLKSNRQ